MGIDITQWRIEIAKYWRYAGRRRHSRGKSQGVKTATATSCSPLLALWLSFCLIIAPSLLLQAGDVERNPGPPKLENVESRLSIDDLADVFEATHPVRTRSFEIGLMLGVPMDTLDSISAQFHSSSSGTLRETLIAWLKTAKKPTWQAIVGALSSPVVGESRLANAIEAKYCTQMIAELQLSQSTGGSADVVGATFKLDSHQVQSNTEEARKQLNKALKKGKVNCKNIVTTITGSAGVGKTCTLCLLLGRDPPKEDKRTSTGLEKPIRTTVAIVKTEDSEHIEWSEVDMLHEIAKKAKATTVNTTADSALDDSSMPQDETQTDDLDLSDEEELDLPPELMKLMDDVAEIMADLDPNKHQEIDLTYIYLIDTGGQPHFHELLRSFVPNISANIFVVNLNESLTLHPKVWWYQGGKPCGKPYTAPFSHEQLLQYTLRALQTSPSLDDNDLQMFVVGTHKDEVSKPDEPEALRKVLEDRTEEFINMLHGCPPKVTYFDDNLPYPLNVKSPGDDDREVAAQLQKAITNQCKPKSQSIPLPWFLLEQMLHKIGEVRGTGMVPKRECQQIAERFFIDSKGFDAALSYLVGLKLLLYYPDVLEKVVFCDPHVILNKITKLVWCSYLFHNETKAKAPADVMMNRCPHWQKFGNYGFVTEKHLRDNSLYTLHNFIQYDFKESEDDPLFTPAQFLKLLVFLRIAVRVPNSDDEEFFMPCLLPNKTDLDRIRSECSSFLAAPLLICFPDNCPPSGFFCKLAVSLLTYGWEIRSEGPRKNKVPRCLFRNCIEYYIEQESAYGYVTLIDPLSLGFFEVYADFPSDCKALYPKAVRDLIKAVNQSWKSFFAECDNLNAPNFAFVCTSEKCEGSKQHPTAGFDHPLSVSLRKKIKCSERQGAFIEITDKHKIWGGEENEQLSQPPYHELSRPPYQQPSQPPYQQPSQPPYQQPSQPPYQQPSQPSYQQPSQPPYQQPSHPPYQQPSQPSYQQPSQPPYQQPNQPPYQQPSQPPYQQRSQPQSQQPSQPPYQQYPSVGSQAQASPSQEVYLMPLSLKQDSYPPPAHTQQYSHPYAQSPQGTGGILQPQPQTQLVHTDHADTSKEDTANSGRDTAQYRKVFSKFDVIVSFLATNSSPGTLASKLWIARLINKDIKNKASVLGIDDENKIRPMIDAVLSQIEMNTENYAKFIKILNDLGAMDDLVETIESA